MGLTITVLGCSGTYAGPGNACSGYLVSDGSTHVYLDCGPGTLANLQQHVPLGAIDAVVVTHCHPDHWLELPVLHNALRYGERRSGVPAYVTAETRRMFEAVLVKGGPPGPSTFEWHLIGDESVFHVGGLRFTCSRTDHPVETLAVRVDAGDRALVYSGDTGPRWSPSTLGEGIDLAVIEATVSAGFEGGPPHLSGRQAGDAGRRAGVARLVITHIWPTDDPDDRRREAEEAFGAPVEVARVGATFEA
jgi:ribonuclease BN (tRNA processing enzyme)